MPDDPHRRHVGDRVLVDLTGAAAATGLSRRTLAVYSSPKRRAQTGFPEPVPGPGRTKRFDLEAVLAWNKDRDSETEDAEDYIGLAELARLRNISHATAVDLAAQSVPDWRDGRDSLLPRPIDEDVDLDPAQIPRGRRWRRDAADRPAVRAPRGRRPGPRPTTADLAAALRTAPAPQTLAALAVALETAGYDQVNTTTAMRLLRQRRSEVLADLIRAAGTDDPDGLRADLAERVPFPLSDLAWRHLAQEAGLDPAEP